MLGVSPRPSGCCGQTGHYPRELAVFSPQAVCQLANSVTALSSYSSVAFCVEYATVCQLANSVTALSSYSSVAFCVEYATLSSYSSVAFCVEYATVCQLANSVTALSSYSSVAFCVEYATVCEEQDPNTKRFKPTLIYFNTDTQVYWAIQRSWFARVNALCNLSQKKSRKNAFWGILKHEQQVIAYIQTHYDNVPQKMPSTLAV